MPIYSDVLKKIVENQTLRDTSERRKHSKQRSSASGQSHKESYFLKM